MSYPTSSIRPGSTRSGAGSDGFTSTGSFAGCSGSQSIEFAGLEGLTPLLARGDGVLITPNHTDNADAGVMFELGHRVRRPFYFMAAYQLFTGLNRIHLPRLGVFPVDREGSDLRAQAMVSGSSYSPQLFAGKTQQQVADALSDPNSDIAKAVGGAANAFTAQLCKLTNNQPADVCSSAAVAAYSGTQN